MHQNAGSRFALSAARATHCGYWLGAGTWLLEFMQWGADPVELCGIDLSADRIASRASEFRMPTYILEAQQSSHGPTLPSTL